MKGNIVQIKSYAFAVRIVKVYKQLCDDKKEYVLSKQLLRAGTISWRQHRRSHRWTIRKRFFC